MFKLKKILLIILISIAMVFAFANISNAAELVIDCQDEKLYRALLDVFDSNPSFDEKFIPNDSQRKITVTDDSVMDTIESLDLSNKGIRNIKGLEKFANHNLQTLNLSKNDISDLDPIKTITTLDTLNISESNISNISALSSLYDATVDPPTGIRTLIANKNNIT